jgi:hypothetical protein
VVIKAERWCWEEREKAGGNTKISLWGMSEYGERRVTEPG